MLNMSTALRPRKGALTHCAARGHCFPMNDLARAQARHERLQRLLAARPRPPAEARRGASAPVRPHALVRAAELVFFPFFGVFVSVVWFPATCLGAMLWHTLVFGNAMAPFCLPFSAALGGPAALAWNVAACFFFHATHHLILPRLRQGAGAYPEGAGWTGKL